MSANDGISYYGVFKQTVIPYVIALLGPSYFSIKAADQLSKDSLKFVKYSFIAMAILTLGVMSTPDTLSYFMANLHKVFGICLFVLQLCLSGWLVARLHYEPLTTAFATLELIGGLASYFYLAPTQGLLLQSQVLFQIGFGGTMIRSLSLILHQPLRGKAVDVTRE